MVLKLQYRSLPLFMGIKYSVNEVFFDTWSSQMAYVLGYLYADGSLEDAWYLRGKYIRVSSIDKSSIELIHNLLESHHPISIKKRNLPCKDQYLLRIGSHRLYYALTKHGLFPNKSLSVQFPPIPQLYFKDFLRGYFDGDGCVFLERAKGITKKLIIKKLSIIFTSGSKIFIERLHAHVSKIICENKKIHRIYNSNRAFQIRYSTCESIKLFTLLYDNIPKGLFLKRKLKIFVKYFILRPSKITSEIKGILKNTGYGHRVK